VTRRYLLQRIASRWNHLIIRTLQHTDRRTRGKKGGFGFEQIDAYVDGTALSI